jgi:hypothetical protein
MSRSTISERATLVAALIVSSCRFGGPPEDRTRPAGEDAAGVTGSGGHAGYAGSDAGYAGSGGASGEGGGIDAGGSAGATADAGYDVADGATADDATADDATAADATPDGVARDAWFFDIRADDGDAPDGEPPDTGPPTACLLPFPSLVCDPVCNAGCPPLLRCDITDTPRTGVCVGTLLSPITEGMACTRTAVTDDCLERLTCVVGICRRLCYHDIDCTTNGTCCNTSIDVDAGPSGYRTCAPCGP